MNEIETIPELISQLKSSPLKNFPSVLKSCNIKISEIENYASWNDDEYSRNCLEKNDEFEVILLCWNPGNVTPIHDHGSQKCWVYQISGEIEEIRFKLEDEKPVECFRHVLKERKLSYIDDQMGYHILKNSSGKRSMSIHIYASPIENCLVFNTECSDFESKVLNFDTIHTGEQVVEAN